MKRFKNIFSKTALEPNDDLTRAKLPFGSSQVFLGLRVALLAAMLLVGVTAMAQDDPEDPQTPIQPKVKVHGSVFGGGNQADVKVNTEMNISTGQVEGNVYGGGEMSYVVTNSNISDQKVIVNLQGNTEVLGNVFGGGDEGLVECSATVNIEQ